MKVGKLDMRPRSSRVFESASVALRGTYLAGLTVKDSYEKSGGVSGSGAYALGRAHLRLLVGFLRARPGRAVADANKVVLLSYPRSGSSWIGEVLSQAVNTSYLREPVTQPYLRVYGGRHALVDVASERHGALVQRMLYDLALRGETIDLPGKLERRPVTVAEGWPSSLLIKEVNPHAACLLKGDANLRVALLLRHPAAVALSFSQMGWLTLADTQKQPPALERAGDWERFGFAYGETLRAAEERLTRSASCELVFYETLAADPLAEFRHLFTRLGLQAPPDYEAMIERYCFAGAETSLESGYHTQRNSAATAEKWKETLDTQALTGLRRGFEHSGCPHYRDEKDWAR